LFFGCELVFLLFYDVETSWRKYNFQKEKRSSSVCKTPEAPTGSPIIRASEILNSKKFYFFRKKK